MNYKSFKHGEHVNNKSDYAYFILKGQILADNGDTFSVDVWYDLDYSFYVVVLIMIYKDRYTLYYCAYYYL